MLTLHATFSLRYLRRRWFRALLIVLSIAAGVSLLVATTALNDTMARAAQAAANPIAGSVDLIVSNGDAPVDRALAGEIKKEIADVAGAHPRIFERVELPDLNQRCVLLIGLDFLAEMSKTDNPNWEVKLTSNPLFAVQGALVGKSLAESLPTEKYVSIRAPGQLKPYEINRAGIIDARGAAAALGGQVLVVDLKKATQILGLRADRVSRIDLDLVRGANRLEVQKKIAALLAGRAEARTPDEQNQTVLNVMASMQVMLLLCGVVALVVGLFLVYNALAVSVAERRHDIGILMAVGATRRQICWLFAGEAFFLGLAGSLLGIPLGWFIAFLGLEPVQSVLSDIFYNVEARQVEISTGLIVVALIAGVLTAVLAALVPAINAARERPADAVRRLPPQLTWSRRFLQGFCSVLLISLGLACVSSRHHLPPRVGTLGGLGMVLIGGLVFTPLVTALFARVLQPLARRYCGIEGRLATDNLVRAASRTGLVIAALASGVALVTGTTGIIRSNRDTLHEWIQDSFAADYFVTSGSPVGSSGKTRPMTVALGKQIQETVEKKFPDSIDGMLPARLRKLTYRDTLVFLIVIEAAEFYRLDSRRADHVADLKQYKELSAVANGVLVSHNFVSLYGVGKGGSIQLASAAGPVNLTVVDQVVDYSWNHGSLILNRDFYVKHWEDERVDVFDLYLKPGVSGDQVKAVIEREFTAEGLFALSRRELQSRVSTILDGLYGIAYAQQVVVMFVAALGVVTSLLISIIQRRRELGLMRAVGASRWQIVRAVLAEAFLMGAIGTLIGVIVGLALEWYALKIVFIEETGFHFPVLIPWVELFWITFMAMLTAALAGLGPALHAMNERIPDAIAME